MLHLAGRSCLRASACILRLCTCTLSCLEFSAGRLLPCANDVQRDVMKGRSSTKEQYLISMTC